MAEFTEVMKQKERMHNSIIYENGGEGCNKKCPLYAISNGGNCNAYLSNCPKHAEELIMKWASEHPIKTNANKFKEVFGFEITKNACIAECNGRKCSVCDFNRDNWANQEYKEPKEV